MIKKDIIYPIFLECCHYADDTFWENVFEDLAYGKAPYGTYFSKNHLCCSYKKKEFSYKIEKKDSNILYKEIYTLLTKRVGLLSQIDKTNIKKNFLDLEDTIKDSRKNWNDIKKKNMKDLLIELFVTRMKEKYLLNIKQARHLLSIILVAMVFKVITTDDINYNNFHIESIDGIDFEKKQVLIKKDLYSFQVSFSPHIFLDKKIMAENWEKYLENLRKIV